MASALRSFVAFTLVSALAVLSAPACSQQGEGERCDKDAEGNADCDSGLTCVSSNDLLENVTDRCCPPVGTESSERCTRRSGTGTGGTGTGGTGTGGTDSGGEAAGGSAAALGGAGGEPGGGAAGEPTAGGAAGAGGGTGGGDAAGAAGMSAAGAAGAAGAGGSE